MTTNAERQRRYRRHKAGDHSECLPENCNAAVTVESRGTKLLRELNAESLPPAQRILAEEAARIADRLDRLDAILEGNRREWLHFRTKEDGDVTVIVNSVLSEARQQASTLKAIVAELRAASASKPGGVPAGQGSKAGSSVTSLTERIAKRRSHPTS